MVRKHSNLGRRTRNAKNAEKYKNSLSTEQRAIITLAARNAKARARAVLNPNLRPYVRRTFKLAAFSYDAKFDNVSHEKVSIGSMNTVCSHCMEFKHELPGMCYANEKVKLPELNLSPEPLPYLVAGGTPSSWHNSDFQMTSFGASNIIQDNFMPTFKKFRFCGDGDCPDWVLGEIISTLSVLEADKLKALADMIAKKILGQDFDEAEVKSLTSSVSSDGKTAVACIHFLLNNAARHNVSELVFNEEIQQLGLPKDHAAAMCDVLSQHATAIRQHLIENAFKINELQSVRPLPPAPDTINCSRLELKISQELVNGLPQDTTHVLNIDNAQLKVLLDEMKYARSIMEKYKGATLNKN